MPENIKTFIWVQYSYIYSLKQIISRVIHLTAVKVAKRRPKEKTSQSRSLKYAKELK
jgi:hypothetical protein